ncbi:TetR/AcrR family transcriptional regulator [Nonomuraea aurantiaca]|uniref:TetR/AcrR family transcriptional regulator n=1 Tax=Nonomuraea aurantiaca TaxID=2878562 RepID=UPI001CD92680|nr:TetR/AcrR family transcriptional regulator [Nonomuraea aurantiaca]MCA2224903.1 TetR/AcrR family transcriptional regulator [Nonomuraea aurantiaca]
MPEQRRRADALRNSDRIVRAAITALHESGTAVPLEEIARRAGVGIATVYRRFGDRDGVILACFETYFAEEIEPVLQAARVAADPRQGLADALTAVVDTLSGHRALLSAAKEAGAFTIGIAERFMGPLGDVLAAARARGLVRDDLLVRDLAAIVVMALATTRHHGADSDDSADRRRYLALLLDGTRPSAVPLPRPSAVDLFAHEPTDHCPRRHHH